MPHHLDDPIRQPECCITDMQRVAPAQFASSAESDLELSIVMPCLNEAETLATCIGKARRFISDQGVTAEIIVADNGSTDGSQGIARNMDVQVVSAAVRGYGAALATGIAAARGRFIVMGDSDDSYDFSALMPFLKSLREGSDIVIGNRFEGGIDAGAMPLLHRYLGTPILAFVARLFFGVKCRDTQCGLRGFKRDAIQSLDLKATGMEYASEMLVRAAIAKLQIVSIPICFAKDGRSRSPHLQTWSDGWRHLRFMLLFSPRWLFFYPGIAMIVLGLAVTLALLPGPVTIALGISLDVHTLLLSCMTILVGTQSITFGMLARRYAATRGFLPASFPYGRILKSITLERLLLLGGVLCLSGVAGIAWAFLIWKSVDFGALNYSHVLRIVVVSATSMAAGLQIAMSGLLVSVMEIEGKHP